MHNITMSHVPVTIGLVEKQQVSYILSVFVALTLHCIVMCGLPRSAIFFLPYNIKGKILEKKFIEN